MVQRYGQRDLASKKFFKSKKGCVTYTPERAEKLQQFEVVGQLGQLGQCFLTFSGDRFGF